MSIKIQSLPYLLVLATCLPTTSFGDFIKMPKITELPEIQRKSLLKDLDIPNVRERDPNPDSGPRLNVIRFKLQGIVEYPKLGITKKEIDSLIESIRFNLMQEYNIQDSGFTKKEIEDVTKLIVEIEDDTKEQSVSELDLDRLVRLVRSQRESRGITLGTIETVADKITQFYRERGFILAKAYIPQQEVRDGIVTLTLLLGRLGDIKVSNNTLYTKEQLIRVFKEMKAKPVTSRIAEENLYIINDFPGVSATGFFQSGTQVGDTLLNLDIRQEKKYDINFSFDNHGSEETGEYRGYAEFIWNNPSQTTDQFHVGLLQTIEPSNTTYGLIRYSTRHFNPRINLSLGYSQNDFVLGPGNSEAINKLGIKGGTKQTNASINYSFKRSRIQNFIGSISLNRIDSFTRLSAISVSGDSGLDDSVQNTAINFEYDILSEKSLILHKGDLTLTFGDFIKGNDEGQSDSYSIFNTNYTLLTFWQVPFFETKTRVIVRSSLQYSGIALSSINQFSLAGPTRSRAYQSNQFSADDAIYIGVDWHFENLGLMDISTADTNLKDIASLFVFLDGSLGMAHSLQKGQADSRARLFNTGIGLQFNYNDNFRGNLILALPISEDFSSDDIEDPDGGVRLVFDLQYNFL